MISKYYCISFIVCSLNFTFAQQLPEQVTLEQAIAFGDRLGFAEMGNCLAFGKPII